MHPTEATPHAAHDELLIARLYGGDVDDAEREHALAQLASCDECGALFADLGTVAATMPALLVPERPRDFTLTAEQAARLRPRRRFAGLAGWARPLGVALSGIGAVVLALVALTSSLPVTSMTTQTLDGRQGGAYAYGSAAGGGANQAASSVLPPTCAGCQSTAASGVGPLTPNGGPGGSPGDASSPAGATPAAGASGKSAQLSPASASQGAIAITTDGHEAAGPVTPPQPAPAPFDTRLAIAGAAGIVLLAGVVLLVVGIASRRASS